MMSNLEPIYIVSDSINEMLSQESLSKQASKPITRVECRLMNEHGGVAGGELNYVNTNAERFVLKRMSMASDWIMLASEDHLCRSVTLWQYGLLDQLRPHLEHKIIACSRDGDGWAILMHDLTGYVPSSDQEMAPDLLRPFLDALARLHATFWNDARLNDPLLGLCDPARMLNQFSLTVAQKHKHLSTGVIADWVIGGWEVMKELLDPGVFAQMRSLIENPQPLIEALSRYPHTLLHGDYRAANIAYLDHPIAFDWQTASCSLMTIDLAWFTQTVVQDGKGLAQAINYYRQRLEHYLNSRFDDLEWQIMVELGHLVDALRLTCFHAFFYKHEENLDERNFYKRLVKQRDQMVKDAMRWL